MVRKQIQEEKEKMAEEVNGNVAVTLQMPGFGVLGDEKGVVFGDNVIPKDKAFSVVFDDVTKKWQAVELTYDLQTGAFGGLKVLEQNPSKAIIWERYQVLSSQNFG